MKTFIVFSLLIHVITLIAVFFLYQKVQSLQVLNLPEMSKLLDKTLNEIKRENDRLQKQLSLANSSEASKLSQTRLTEKDKGTRIKARETKIPVANPVKPSIHSVESLLDQSDSVQYEPSKRGQILNLHEKGLTIEQIAQQLNCGKTEVELIIQFQKKE